jgi:hypothetical protein
MPTIDRPRPSFVTVIVDDEVVLHGTLENMNVEYELSSADAMLRGPAEFGPMVRVRPCGPRIAKLSLTAIDATPGDGVGSKLRGISNGPKTRGYTLQEVRAAEARAREDALSVLQAMDKAAWLGVAESLRGPMPITRTETKCRKTSIGAASSETRIVC